MWVNYLLIGALALWFILGVLDWVPKFKKSLPGQVTNVKVTSDDTDSNSNVEPTHNP